MKFIRIFLLILIFIGTGLLFTQNMWVPKVVDYMLKGQSYTVVKKFDIATSTIKKNPTVPATRKGKVDTGVEGIATSGPTCPVEHYPVDPTCADRPFESAFIISNNSKNSDIVVHTDAHGYFSQELSPGTYTIHTGSPKAFSKLSPIVFTVVLHKLTSLNLYVDSGIR